MTNNQNDRALQQIKKTYDNITVVSGVTMGLLLCITFFTYGMLLDSSAAGMLWVQIIISIILIFCLIFIKRVSFFLAKILLAGNPECRQVLNQLSIKDLEKIDT